MNPVLIFGAGAAAVYALVRGANMLRGGAPAETAATGQAMPIFAGAGGGGAGGGAEIGRTVGGYYYEDEFFQDEPAAVSKAPAVAAVAADRYAAPYPADAAMEEAPVRDELPEIVDEPVYSIQPVHEELVPERPVIANPITGESKTYQPPRFGGWAPIAKPPITKVAAPKKGAAAKKRDEPPAKKRDEPKRERVKAAVSKRDEPKRAQPPQDRKGARKR